MKSIIMDILKWLLENLPLLVLVFITYLYLRETKKIRQTTEKSFLVESSPKVFLENIVSAPRLNEQLPGIEVSVVFKMRNVGKTEAKNVEGNYILSANQVEIKGKFGPVTKLFPTQVIQYESNKIIVRLNEQNFAIAKEAKEKKMSVIFPKDVVPPVFLDLNLKYFDHENNQQSVSYKFKYTFYNNTWVYITD